MADYLQSLDPRSLLVLETVLSFTISPLTSPSYNLPLFLFGVYSQESSESSQSLKLFTGLLGASALFDIIWLFRNSPDWFSKLVLVIILLLKVRIISRFPSVVMLTILKGPTFFTFLTALRQRGEQFSGLNIRGGDLNGPTLWSMPGGFSSLGRSGYENVDGGDVESNPRPSVATRVNVAATPQAPTPAPAPPNANQAAPGGYQTI